MTWALKIWNGLMFMLCRLVYLFIKWLYQVFEAVAKANLFTEEVFDELTGRIYLIMGIAMLFIFAYNLVFMIVDPDNKTTNGKMGKIVKETIVSLIAVVLLPTIFNYMYTFQNHVVSSNILGQLILGGTGTGVQDPSECDEGDYECKCDFSFLSSGGSEITTECEKYRNLSSSKRGANLVPVTIFSAFYRPANFTLNECANHLANNTDDITGDDHDICVNYYTGYQKAKYTGKINYLIDNDDLKDGIYEDPQLMEFDHIFALLAGLLGAWMFLCYAMEIGVRVFKLGVLQLISPIPVMMRVVPGQKEKMYDKWFKELLNTYLDVFIRLIIIFFALFAVSLVPEMIETLWSSIADSDSNAFVKLLAMVIVILGILKFAQEAPELLKTFFGSAGGGKFALRSPRKQLQDNKLAMGGLGMAGGLAKTGIGNSIRAFKQNRQDGKGVIRSSLSGMRHGMGGMAAGAYRGFKEGYKTNDLANLGDSIDRAKALSDERYAKRDTRRVLRENDADRFLADRNIDASEHKYLKGAVAGTVGRYKAVGRAVGDFFENVESWGGTSAYDDVKVKANQTVKDYQTKLASRIDTKGNISGITEGREELKKKIATRELNIHDLVNKGIIRETGGKFYDDKNNEIKEHDIVAMEGAIHSAYSKTIDEGRASALINATGIDLKEWKQSIENLTQSMKENSDFLDNFSGPEGFLVKEIGEKFKSDRAFNESEFKKAFSGSIDDFNKGLNDYLAKDEAYRKDPKNKEIAKAFAVAIDKIGSTNDANIRMATNKKQSDKK